MARKTKRKNRPFRGGMGCHWCGREMKNTKDTTALGATRDHVHPRCLGGRKTVWACRACNNVKGSMTEGEWRQFMADNPQWWKLYSGTRLQRFGIQQEAEHG